MTALCITGHHPHSLNEVAAHLGQAGMAAAQPLQRDPSVTLQVWHQRVGAQSGGTAQPSRLWEQLAVDLLLANIDAPVWGWADTQSYQLLDFWAQLDSDMRFVLLCHTPQQAITQLLVSGTAQDTSTQAPGSATAQALADWHSHHQALLRFHLRHPTHSVMVWADQAQHTPQALIHHLNQHWHLALTETAPLLEASAPQTTHADATPNAVLHQLVEHIAGLHPELDELNRELQATVTQLTGAPDPEADPEADTDADSEADPQAEEHHEATPPASAVDALIASYRRLTDRSTEQAALQAQAEALAQRDADSQAKAEAEAQLKDAQQEGELLLLQLHQVQEELEKYYLQHQEANTQLAALNTKFDAEAKARAEAIAQRDAEAKAKNDAIAQREQEAKAKAEALAQRDALNNEKTQLNVDKATLTKAHAEAIAQRDAEAKAKNDAIAQREQEAKAKAEALAQRDALNSEKMQLSADNAALTKAHADAVAAHAAEAQAKAEAQAQLKDAQQEGELLLQQLHQVQEELEKYYLQHQEAQREVQAHSERWKRLLKAQPDLCDFDAVELLSDGGEGQPLQWRLNDASMAGRSFKQLNVGMIIEDGVAGFVIHRSANGESPLLRWPASAKSEREITIIPVNGGAAAQRRAAHLVQLCASDWGLMLALPNALTQALQRGHLAIKPAHQQTLIKALGRYKHIMDNMQGLVRFDRVSLTGQQSAGLRNVLAIKLDQTRYGQHSLTNFTFQLQINKNAAGQPDTAHFIFDEKTASAPFETWASNMLNTVGQPVMAVRLDARGWLENASPQLSPDDQRFMNALADSLAVMLVTLQADGTRADYPWQDWIKDAALLRQWSRQARQAVTPSALTDAAEPPQAALAATQATLSRKAKAPGKAKTAAPKVKPAVKAKSEVKTKPAAVKPVGKAKPKVKATVKTPLPTPATATRIAKAKTATNTRPSKGAGN